ncbi:ferrochelatase [Mobilicoccus pelagius]|uniref:Coproporphyrin III ferrochelatase n=1 Tax=Mobilicoccus pelagius NBRC 104925 TaxID=1089455 RepID=H5UUN0_9MICO|nr:ferrochelatase [Mobilicoccus pelagius]GAB49438.1 ferrochelatase [Mobilicoccus pelagius NBRC 104925]
MNALAPYDAVLLLSFGGPEGPEEVLPFLRHVTGGRGIPDGRLAEVAHHYDIRGGVSPINGENRRLVAALEAQLAERGESLPILWGNRHAAPFTADALREARERGLTRLVALVTSAYPSYSGCRQYRQDLADSMVELGLDLTAEGGRDGGGTLVVDKVRPYADHPGFVEAVASRTVAAVQDFLAAHELARPHLAFVTHSIPTAMAGASGPAGDEYVRRHEEIAELVTAAVREALAGTTAADALDMSLVYCSRSGPPHQPWLEPDICDHLRDLADAGVDGVVVSPIGFVADHMEVVHDLDTEAAEVAADLGIAFVRVPTVRDDPAFVIALADLLEERAAEARGEDVSPATVSPSGALPSLCVPGCCPDLRPGGPRPALCGVDSPGPADDTDPGPGGAATSSRTPSSAAGAPATACPTPLSTKENR